MTKLLALLIVVLGTTAAAQAPDAAQLLTQLASERQRLGVCNAELGALQQLSAQVIAGQIQPVSQTLAQVKTAFERAHPGQTVNTTTWAIETVPAQ